MFVECAIFSSDLSIHCAIKVNMPVRIDVKNYKSRLAITHLPENDELAARFAQYDGVTGTVVNGAPSIANNKPGLWGINIAGKQTSGPFAVPELFLVATDVTAGGKTITWHDTTGTIAQYDGNGDDGESEYGSDSVSESDNSQQLSQNDNDDVIVLHSETDESGNSDMNISAASDSSDDDIDDNYYNRNGLNSEVS